MNTTVRLLTVVLLGLGLGLIGGTHAVYAAGTQVQDCTFATLDADLQAGGDWYYAPGQCPGDIFAESAITIGTTATLTAEGSDVGLVNDHGSAIFSVTSGGALGLTGLTFAGGSAQAVTNSGGTVAIANSSLLNFHGGAVSNGAGGTMSITASALLDNQAVNGSGQGGAIYNNGGTVTVSDSEFELNSGSSGGAVENNGTMTITNGTFYANSVSSDRGGAIVNDGTLTVTNSTLSENTGTGGASMIAGPGQAIYNAAGTLFLAGTIISNVNGSAANCFTGPEATLADEGYNLDTDGSCLNGGTGDTITSSPGLDPAGLKDNGGYAPTIALVAGSPALDAIPLSYDFTGSTLLCPPTDQRGVVRPDNGENSCDIGAYEAGEPTTTTLASSANPSVVGQQVTYKATVGPTPDGGTVTFSEGPSGNEICARVPISTSGPDAGTATCSATYTSTGSHSITVTYGGVISYMSSTSSALNQTVNRASTTTLVTPSINPSILAQPVTLTAAVSVIAPGAGMPTGTVTFRDGATTLGSGTLDATGTATLTTSSLTAGTHFITAAYSGDASFVGNTSSTLPQQVSYVISTLAASISRKGTTIDVQAMNYNNVNVSVKTITVTALCVVAYSTTPPASCPSHPIQSINSPFTFVKNDMKMGSGYSYTVSPTGLTAGTQYYLLVQADGDPVFHAVVFSD